MVKKTRTARGMYELLRDGVEKGHLVRFRTSSRSPKTWYLVRDTPRHHTPDPEWSYRLPGDYDGWAYLLGKRGGEYVVAWEMSWPGPEHEVWLHNLDSGGVGDRVRLTGFEVKERRYPQDYVADYLGDRHMVEAWPDV